MSGVHPFATKQLSHDCSQFIQLLQLSILNNFSFTASLMTWWPWNIFPMTRLWDCQVCSDILHHKSLANEALPLPCGASSVAMRWLWRGDVGAFSLQTLWCVKMVGKQWKHVRVGWHYALKERHVTCFNRVYSCLFSFWYFMYIFLTFFVRVWPNEVWRWPPSTFSLVAHPFHGTVVSKHQKA